MSKERLKDARETMAYIKMCESKEMHNQEQADIAKCYFYERHGDWLIKQADRVQELEKRVVTSETEEIVLRNANKRIKNKNKRYQEAIESIGNAWKLTNDYQEYMNAIHDIIKDLEGEE